RTGDRGDDLVALRLRVRHELPDRLDDRTLVLDDVRLDDRRRERRDAERRDPRAARSLLDLGELHAARADVEHEKAELATERILELRGKKPFDERLTAQTFGERQGILLLISLPHPTARHRSG